MRSLLFLLLLPVFSFAQQTFEPSKKVLFSKMKSISENIKLDGLLNEPGWQNAEVAKDFVQIEPNQGKKSDFKTEVRVLSNNQLLYVRVICHDTVGRNHYLTPDLKRDFAWYSFDMFTVCIDAVNRKRIPEKHSYTKAQKF